MISKGWRVLGINWLKWWRRREFLEHVRHVTYWLGRQWQFKFGRLKYQEELCFRKDLDYTLDGETSEKLSRGTTVWSPVWRLGWRSRDWMWLGRSRDGNSGSIHTQAVRGAGESVGRSVNWAALLGGWIMRQGVEVGRRQWWTLQHLWICTSVWTSGHSKIATITAASSSSKILHLETVLLMQNSLVAPLLGKPSFSNGQSQDFSQHPAILECPYS